MDPREYKELCEHIHSIENRCRIFRILCEKCRVDEVEVVNGAIDASKVYKRARRRSAGLRRLGLRLWAEKLGFNHFVSDAYPNASVYNLLDTTPSDNQGES